MAAKAKTYAQLAGELQAIIDWFESDDVDLDEAVQKYQAANKLVEELEKYLKTAENHIKKVAKKP